MDHFKGGLSHGEIVARSAESECVSGVVRVEWSIGVKRSTCIGTVVRIHSSMLLTSCWSVFRRAGKHREFVDKHGQKSMMKMVDYRQCLKSGMPCVSKIGSHMLG